MEQLPTDHTSIKYQNNKTYVALIYGDMDNLNFVQTFGSDNMKNRRRLCEANPESMFLSGIFFIKEYS